MKELLPEHFEPLATQEEISRRLAEIGREISSFYSDRDLTVVAIANGGILFAADLVRAIDLPLKLDVIAVSSYRQDRAGDQMVLRAEPKLDPAGADILLVDEVLDTGRTLLRLIDYFRNRGAASVRTAVAVDKKRERPDGLAKADWTCFSLPDRYLVGYGLDSCELYRNLPVIGAIGK